MLQQPLLDLLTHYTTFRTNLQWKTILER